MDVDNVVPENNPYTKDDTQQQEEVEEENEVDLDEEDLSEEEDFDNIELEKDENIEDAASFFSGSISKQAKGNNNDSKLEKEWDKLTPEEKMGAANVMKMYSAQDLIASYNKTAAKVDISISKFMKNLKCNI